MSKKCFRIIVALSLLLNIPYALTLAFFNPPLPAELAVWSAANQEITTAHWISFGFGVAALIASIALLFFARWSRHVFALATIVITLLILFTGPLAVTAPEMFFLSVDMLLAGFIIALAYFSDAKVYFGPNPQ